MYTLSKSEYSPREKKPTIEMTWTGTQFSFFLEMGVDGLTQQDVKNGKKNLLFLAF